MPPRVNKLENPSPKDKPQQSELGVSPMAFIVISGFYPEPNPDNSILYEKSVPQELQPAVLAAMGWTSLGDVPVGESDLTQDQAIKVMAILGDPINSDLMYCLGLCS